MLKREAGKQTVQQTSRTLGAPPLPNDHGAYAMLLIPMLIGFVLGAIRGNTGGATPEAAIAMSLFAVSLMSLFFASEPVGVAFRPNASTFARRRAMRWLGIYLLVAALAGAPLLFAWQLWALGWFAAAASLLMLLFLVAVKKRKQRSLGVRLPGIVGLTLSGPAAYYVAMGELGGAAWGLCVACAVYFAGTIFNVRAWFEINKQKKSGVGRPKLPTWLIASILLYIAAGALVLSSSAWAGALPWAALLALVPSLFRVIWTLLRTPAHLPIKTVGLIELVQSFLFAALLIFTMTAY